MLEGAEYDSPLRVATVQNTNADKYALRQGDWLFINSHTGASKREGQEYLDHFGLTAFSNDLPGLLFNLKDDPRQSKNLYDKHPEIVARMEALLARYIGGERCAPAR